MMNDDKNLINENEKVKYRVVVNGQVIAERESQHLAESFVSGLLPEEQQKARIIPVTESGQQLLFE